MPVSKSSWRKIRPRANTPKLHCKKTAFIGNLKKIIPNVSQYADYRIIHKRNSTGTNVEHQHAIVWTRTADSRTNFYQQAKAAQSHDIDPQQEKSFQLKQSGTAPNVLVQILTSTKLQRKCVKLMWILQEGSVTRGVVLDRCAATIW